MTPNFTAPKNLQDKYNLQWETEALKYLGIERDFKIITRKPFRQKQIPIHAILSSVWV